MDTDVVLGEWVSSDDETNNTTPSSPVAPVHRARPRQLDNPNVRRHLEYDVNIEGGEIEDAGDSLAALAVATLALDKDEDESSRSSGSRWHNSRPFSSSEMRTAMAAELRRLSEEDPSLTNKQLLERLFIKFPNMEELSRHWKPKSKEGFISGLRRQAGLSRPKRTHAPGYFNDRDDDILNRARRIRQRNEEMGRVLHYSEWPAVFNFQISHDKIKRRLGLIRKKVVNNRCPLITLDALDELIRSIGGPWSIAAFH